QTQPSTSATAGVAFGQQPVVRVEDQFGNLRVNDNATLVNATRAAGSGSLQGSTSLMAIAGLIWFTDLAHNVATNITIQFASAGLASATSSIVAISPASASRLSIQTQPSATATAGTPFAQQPIIRIEDAFGNLVGSDSSHVVTATRNAGYGALQGASTLTALNGRVSFTNLAHNVATNISITFTTSDLAPITSTNIAVNPGAFTKLQLLLPGETSAPDTPSGKSGIPQPQIAGTALNVTVNAADPYWNLVSSISDVVSLASPDPNASLPTNTPLASGSKILSATFKTAGSQTITATDATQPAKSSATSPGIQVASGAFTKLQ